MEMHDGENAEFIRGDGILESIREALAQPTPDGAQDDRPGERVRHDRLGAPLDVRDKGAAEARLLEFVIVRRVVELALGQLVERDAHCSDPRASAPKHIGGWAR